jgi:hypothetical protein
LARLNGIWTNAVSMTARNGGSTYSVGVGQGTYLGSIQMDGTNGQVSCYRSWGQSRKWGIWNAYNRANIYLKAGDSTGNWTYTGNIIRPSNNNTANSLTIFTGLAEEAINYGFCQKISFNGNANCQNLIGVNSTTANVGKSGNAFTGAALRLTTVDGKAEYLAPPTLGANVATCLETAGAAFSGAFYGTEDAMLLSALYRG